MGPPSQRPYTRRETLRYGAVSLGGLAATGTGTTHLPSESGVDPRWTANVVAGFLYAPAVVGDTVVAESDTHTHGFALDDGTLRWRVPGTSGSTASTGHGRAYAVDGGDLRALDPRTGDPDWLTPLPVGDVTYVYAIRTTPERVVVSASGGLYGFDAATGDHRWSVETRRVLGTTTPVADGQVYVRDGDTLGAYDLRTGERRWAAETGERVSDLVAADGERVYVATTGGVVALDAGSGEWVWQWTVDGTFYGQQGAVVGGVLLVPGERGGETTDLVALGATDGRHRWTHDAGSSGVETGLGGPTVVDGVAYVVEGVRTVTAVDIATGDRRWSTDVDGNSPTGILDVHDGVVYHPTDAGVFALDAADGSVRWHYPVRAALYARVHDGVVFVGAHGGRLLAFDTSDGPLARPLGTLTTHPLAALGVGGLLAGVLWAGARVRRRGSPADTEGAGDGGTDPTVLRTTDRRTVSAVTRDGEPVVRTEFLGHFDEESRTAFIRGMERWSALGAVAGVCPVGDWGTSPTPWYETPVVGEDTVSDAESWEAATHALVRVCTALDGTDDSPDLRAGDVVLADPAGGTAAVVRELGFGDFRGAAWGDIPASAPEAAPEEAETGPTTATAVYRVGRIGEIALDGFAVPDELRDVLTTATAERPHDRYDSLADLRVNLRWAGFAR